jgi:hypothetical protein
MYTAVSSRGHIGTYTALRYMHLCTDGQYVTPNLTNGIQPRLIKTVSTGQGMWGEG